MPRLSLIERLAILAAILLALLIQAAPAAALGDQPLECLVAIDGDSFRVCGSPERIRAIDYDTPELRGRCAEETEKARQALDYARLLLELSGGAVVVRQPMRDRPDPYGRTLALVIVRIGGDWRSIGDVLREHGLARRWDGRRRPWC